ncbi:MAG: putative DNA-binding domain-containing protein [Acidobacteria bacterium]|nr:putative DNA-binding domain-containing protein [Acidobacteriota bacterium]
MSGDPGVPARPPLDVVQQWFQAVVTHPAGVAAGAASPAAQDLVRLDRGALERLVRRSSRLTAEQRLEIYANAYYARLLECLRDGFPVLTQVLGAEVFDSFAFDYLQRYPSRSYTLNRLAESFPRFLDETRPDRAVAEGPAAAAPPSPPRGTAGAPPPPGWPDFLIDLATLELAIAEVFDGPGAEGETLLAPADLMALKAAGRFAAARLAPVPCLRLLRFRYPVNAFYSVARPVAAAAAAETAAAAAAAGNAASAPGAAGAKRAELSFPDPGEEHVALSRTDFVVRRYTLSPFEAAILAALLAGAAVGEAIASAAAASEQSDDDLAPQLDAAFRRWTTAGFFRAAAAP